MILHNCHIDRYKSLSNVNINFDNVFSNIPDEKRAMRNDLTDFIASMLYGYNGMRGHEYGGSITFSAKGKAYKVTRYFGVTKDKDKCEIIDVDTGLVTHDFSDRLGCQLFALDFESFIRSSLISINRIGNYDSSDNICKEAIKLIEGTKDADIVEKALYNISALIESLSETDPNGIGYGIIQEIQKNEEIISHEPLYRENEAQLNLNIQKETATRDAYINEQSEIGSQIKDAEDHAALIKKAAEYRELIRDFKLAEISYSGSEKVSEEELNDLNDKLKVASDLIGKWNSRIAKSNALEIKELNLKNTLKEIEESKIVVPVKPVVTKTKETVKDTKSESNLTTPVEKDVTVSVTTDAVNPKLSVLILIGVGAIIAAVIIFVISMIIHKSLFIFEGIIAIAGFILIAVGLLRDNSDVDNKQQDIKLIKPEINDHDETNGSVAPAVQSGVSVEDPEPEIVYHHVNYEAAEKLKEEIASDAAYVAGIDNEVSRYLKENDTEFDVNSAGGFLQYIQSKAIENLSTAKAQNKMHLSLKEKFDVAKKNKEDFEANNDVTVLNRISENEIAQDTTKLRIRFNSISDEIERIDNILWEYDDEMDSIKIKLDTIHTAKVKLDELKRMKNANVAKIDVLKEAGQYIQISHKNLIDKYLQPMLNSYAKYHGIIVNGSDNKYAIESANNNGVNPKLNEICMRLAFTDVVYKNEKPFIVMNDCFGGLDMTETRKAMRLLDEISGKYQVIYYATK